MQPVSSWAIITAVIAAMITGKCNNPLILLHCVVQAGFVASTNLIVI